MAKKTKQKIEGLIGVAFDQEDGEKRITRNENILLVGGSEETHERMQDISIHFNEALKERGKQITEAEVEEVVDLLREAVDRS